MAKQKLMVTNKRFGIETTPSINAYLNSLPKSAVYRRKAATGTTEELDVDARTEVSVITTNAVDGDFESIDPKGMRKERYDENPVVLMCHDYHALPVGKCQWIKSTETGYKAKTWYPPRPKDLVGDWFVDTCFALVQADVLRGKSIGFVELKSHVPNQKEIDSFPFLENCKRIIDDWDLLEYSVVSVPCNPEAVLMEKIAKGLPADHLKRLGIEIPKPQVIKEVVKDQLKKRGLKIEDLTSMALKILKP